FINTGTLFFKDRDLDLTHSEYDGEFFHRMLPTVLDDILFDIPATSNYTIKNPFMDPKMRRRHYMEAGVVVYRKSAHFTGSLMAFSMNFWNQAREKLWGDKEMFWLGMSMAGDENYGFNGNCAGSVGKVTPKEFRPDGVVSAELCSIQPAHISSDDDQTLLWINSGFKFCKKMGTFDSFKKNQHAQMFSGARSLLDLETFNELSIKKMYHDSISIEAAIIPPGAAFKREKKGEPRMGWEQQRSCGGYLWCGFTNVGGSLEENFLGKLVHFSIVDKLRFKFLGDLWTGYGIVQQNVPERKNPF
ncbi:glycosyltransferase family 71 protein, partial [Babjeviella inositovora NRRL Y-12698]